MCLGVIGDDGFDDVVSDEELDAAIRRRVMVDDEFFEEQWRLHGPLPDTQERVHVHVPPAALDNPWGHKRHLDPEEAAARERHRAAKRKKRNPLMRGRY